MVMLVKSGLKLTARGERRGGGGKESRVLAQRYSRCSLTDCVAYRRVEKHRCGGSNWGCCVSPESCTQGTGIGICQLVIITVLESLW